MRNREVEPILKTVLSSDRRLQPACVKAESLVIADQLRRGEYVSRALYTPPVTSRKLVVPEVAVLTARRQVPKAWSVIGVKS